MNTATLTDQDQTIETDMCLLRENCIVLLDKLAQTCCLPSRSDRMRQLNEHFRELGLSLSEESPQEKVETSITSVEKCGETIGGLFVTCCTPKREKLYLQLIHNLSAIHTSLWKLKGFVH